MTPFLTDADREEFWRHIWRSALELLTERVLKERRAWPPVIPPSIQVLRFGPPRNEPPFEYVREWHEASIDRWARVWSPPGYMTLAAYKPPSWAIRHYVGRHGAIPWARLLDRYLRTTVMPLAIMAPYMMAGMVPTPCLYPEPRK